VRFRRYREDGEIEIQGDHVAKVAGELQRMGYRVRG
jgi:translation initiation factor 1 (eIF-1/SUI1)